MGHGGYNKAGIRVGGQEDIVLQYRLQGKDIFAILEKIQCWTLDNFKMAFRKLRQYSSRVDVAKTELDIDKTIDETSDNAGLFDIGL